MTVAVQGPAGSAWLDTLLHGPFDLLSHLIWIAENTLNANLFERCLELLLSIAYKREETLQQMLEAGIMLVIINALKACTHALQQDAALQPGAQEPPDSNDDTPGPAPSHAAALAALTICEVLAQDPDDPLFSSHCSTLCSLSTQMLALHDFLQRKANMQCVLVVLLACLDSSQWVPSIVTNAAALEAVLEVLKDDYGFEEEVEADRALQGQEAAWAVLAAVSNHLASRNAVFQVFSRLADSAEVLTDSSLAEVAPGSASYVWRTLLQALDGSSAVRDPDWQQAEARQQSKLSAFKVQLTEALRRAKQLM
ncbi:TPA: hypothetical protein ACH3X1_015003 [Trebouxia sp. C0004]